MVLVYENDYQFTGSTQRRSNDCRYAYKNRYRVYINIKILFRTSNKNALQIAKQPSKRSTRLLGDLKRIFILNRFWDNSL